MAAIFSRTLRSLREDEPRSSVAAIAFTAVVLVTWGLWFGTAKVRLVHTSDSARIETSGVARPIQSTMAGRVAATHLELDRAVESGDALVELDARAERLQLEEARQKLAATKRELDFLHGELAADESAQQEDHHASGAALAGSRALEREAFARSKLAGEESTRAKTLREQGHLGEMEALRAAAEAASKKANAEASVHEAARAAWDIRKRASERRAAIAHMYREIAIAEGDVAHVGTEIERLEIEIERHIVRSPVAGRIGEVVPLPIGSVIDPGTVLAAVVPPGELRVVAEFPAATAIGHVAPGQRATIRLTGFQWPEFGILQATVARVGNEARDGRVRVELRLDESSSTRVPTQHGLAGVAEVEVERVTPARLLLRTIGAALGPAKKPVPPSEPIAERAP